MYWRFLFMVFGSWASWCIFIIVFLIVVNDSDHANEYIVIIVTICLFFFSREICKLSTQFSFWHKTVPTFWQNTSRTTLVRQNLMHKPKVPGNQGKISKKQVKILHKLSGNSGVQFVGISISFLQISFQRFQTIS